jgi:hypothetical protein
VANDDKRTRVSQDEAVSDFLKVKPPKKPKRSMLKTAGKVIGGKDASKASRAPRKSRP